MKSHHSANQSRVILPDGTRWTPPRKTQDTTSKEEKEVGVDDLPHVIPLSPNNAISATKPDSLVKSPDIRAVESAYCLGPHSNITANTEIKAKVNIPAAIVEESPNDKFCIQDVFISGKGLSNITSLSSAASSHTINQLIPPEQILTKDTVKEHVSFDALQLHGQPKQQSDLLLSVSGDVIEVKQTPGEAQCDDAQCTVEVKTPQKSGSGVVEGDNNNPPANDVFLRPFSPPNIAFSKNLLTSEVVGSASHAPLIATLVGDSSTPCTISTYVSSLWGLTTTRSATSSGSEELVPGSRIKAKKKLRRKLFDENVQTVTKFKKQSKSLLGREGNQSNANLMNGKHRLKPHKFKMKRATTQNMKPRSKFNVKKEGTSNMLCGKKTHVPNKKSKQSLPISAEHNMLEQSTLGLTLPDWAPLVPQNIEKPEIPQNSQKTTRQQKILMASTYGNKLVRKKVNKFLFSGNAEHSNLHAVNNLSMKDYRAAIYADKSSGTKVAKYMAADEERNISLSVDGAATQGCKVRILDLRKDFKL
jgi:hypothetical protein